MPYIKKQILLSSHPSPFSAKKRCGGAPSFFGSQPFSKANHFLAEYHIAPIVWELES